MTPGGVGGIDDIGLYYRGRNRFYDYSMSRYVFGLGRIIWCLRIYDLTRVGSMFPKYIRGIGTWIDWYSTGSLNEIWWRRNGIYCWNPNVYDVDESRLRGPKYYLGLESEAHDKIFGSWTDEVGIVCKIQDWIRLVELAAKYSRGDRVVVNSHDVLIEPGCWKQMTCYALNVNAPKGLVVDYEGLLPAGVHVVASNLMKVEVVNDNEWIVMLSNVGLTNVFISTNSHVGNVLK
jgi:hypothetical protein